MCEIYPVPASLQQPHKPYPPHSQGIGLEAELHRWIAKIGVPDGWTYLPVYWTNNYHAQAKATGRCELQPVQDAMQLLTELDPDKRYFTVVQCDDGAYELNIAQMHNHSRNVLVFGAGGVGDISIPLLCDPHPVQPERERDILASFCGAIECGGPQFAPGTAPHSSWNKDGPGALCRRMMRDVCRHMPDVVIEEGSSNNTERFRELMSRSRYALCPRGYGATSFRLYEALQFGAVPIYISDQHWWPNIAEQSFLEYAVGCSLAACHLRDLLDEARELDEPIDSAEIAERWRGILTYENVAKDIIGTLENEEWP